LSTLGSVSTASSSPKKAPKRRASKKAQAA
jgi:hypothetical protein